MAAVQLPWAAWYHDEQHVIDLPDSMAAHVLSPAGGRPLEAEEIAAALIAPDGAAPIYELAEDAESCCIAVDDLTRPTQVRDVVEPLLGMLLEAGLKEHQIQFVVATGSHAALSANEVQLKLGEAIASRYAVTSHDCRGELSGTGIQYGDNELKINARFLSADLRIVIGSVLPHTFAGFSGGAKLVLPGLSDLDSLRRSHKMVQLGRKISADPNENLFRREAEQLVRQIGVHLAVCVVSDAQRRTIGVAAGEVVAAHRRASEIGRAAFATPLSSTYDAMILNAYPKDADLVQAANALLPLKGMSRPPVGEQGLYVLCTAAVNGVGEHGVFAPGDRGRPPAPLRGLGGRDLWVYAPSLSAEQVHSMYWEGYRMFREGVELQAALAERLRSGARIAVLPCAPMQVLQDLRND